MHCFHQNTLEQSADGQIRVLEVLETAPQQKIPAAFNRQIKSYSVSSIIACLYYKVFGTAPGTIRAEHTCVYTATGDTNITDTKLLYIFH